MGNIPSEWNQERIIQDSEAKSLFTHKEIISLPDCEYSLCRFSVVEKESPQVKEFLDIVKIGVEDDKYLNSDPKFDKCMASLLGNVIGDALGAPVEFSSVRYNSKEVTGFDKSIWSKIDYNKFTLKPGQWTDDSSMMLCLAESLIHCQKFNAIDLRCRFHAWIQHGYCNAFGYDSNPRGSVGLGGNISLSMAEFEGEDPPEFTKRGDKNTSGNGSIMRNAPVPIFFAQSGDIENAELTAGLQSLTTHQGIEASECCKVMTHIIMKAFDGESIKSALNNLATTFKSDIYSINCLISSKQEERNENNKAYKLEDRNWNWKDENFKYSPTRSIKQPGYIGSYAMDNLSMSLHCVWSTTSFSDALLKCVNMRGDADSVAAVCGQIAGAFYGMNGVPQKWISQVLEHDPFGLIPYRCYLLYYKKDFVK